MVLDWSVNMISNQGWLKSFADISIQDEKFTQLN